jgi:AcrR family transcriptional regulator
MKNNKKIINSQKMEKKIYDTAKNLFQEYGYKGVTVDSIVEKAGVAKGSFYVHFESKSALLSRLISEQINLADLTYESFINDLSPTIKESEMIIKLVDKIATYLSEDIGVESMSMLYEILITKKEDTQAVLGYNRKLYNLFAKIINQGIQNGEFKSDIEVDTVTKHSILALRGLTYEWCLRYPDFNLKNETVKHFQLFLDGITKRTT